MGFTVDPDIIERARSDGAALEELMSRIWPEAYRMAFGILNDRGLAEDAAQESCAAIAASIATLRSSDAFYGWMYRIIVRQATSAAKRSRKNSTVDRTAIRDVGFDETYRLDIVSALARLPVPQRTVFLLRYYAGLNSREIAAATGAPSATVRFRLMQARRALRVALSVSDHPLTANLEVSANV